MAGYNNAVDECQEENGALLDHLTKSSTQFVINKIQSQSSDQSSSKTLMVWVGAMRERTSNFRGEEWLWESSKDPVISIPWGRGQYSDFFTSDCYFSLDSDLKRCFL